MRGKIIVTMFVIAFVFGIEQKANAAGEESLPPSNSPFWQVLDDSQITSPDDADCATVAATFVSVDQASSMCAGIAMIKSGMQSGMNSDGVTTNLFSQSDWKHINNLYFEKTGYGKIEFSNEINFMSYGFMQFMDTFRERMEMQRGEISLDADVVNGLRGTGAILTMYNVPSFTDPIILVDDEEDTEGVVSHLVYDSTARTLTFDASHFTSFTASERSALNRPKIADVDAYIFTGANGKKYVKVEISGKHFKKKSKVTLSGKKATKNSFSSNKKLKATFSLNELYKKGKNSFSVKVRNPNEKTRTYSKKLKLSELTETK